MKKFVIYTIAIIVILITSGFVMNYPVFSRPKDLPSLADTVSIRTNLEAIIHTSDYRNYRHTSVLDSVASFLRRSFLEQTDSVTTQAYEVEGNSYSNIIASFGPLNAERIIVGAHYDVCGDQDGADDNASGVAGLLELARLLRGQDLKYRIDLVAYTLEEPPFFRSDKMGSYIHAQWLKQNNVPVKGMISLEMIGYFSSEPNSQRYPISMMKWFYGDKGNYITLVQKPFDGAFSRRIKKLAFSNNSIDMKSFKAPSLFGGIDLSDHRNYWKFGYSAVMITNTAFFRNENYHKKSDMLETLDIPRMALVIDGVFRTLISY